MRRYALRIARRIAFAFTPLLGACGGAAAPGGRPPLNSPTHSIPASTPAAAPSETPTFAFALSRIEAASEEGRIVGFAAAPDGALFAAAAEPAQLFRSTDGGASFVVATPPGVAEKASGFAGVAFAADGAGILVGAEGPLWRTTDGGRSWRGAAPIWSGAAVRGVGRVENQFVTFGDGGRLAFVEAASARFELAKMDGDHDLMGWCARADAGVVVVGGGGTVRAVDAERRVRRTATAEAEPLFAAAFVDARRGFVAGRAGYVAATEDGGATWRAEGLAVGATWRAAAVSDGLVLLFGDEGARATRSASGAWTIDQAPRRDAPSWRAAVTLGDGTVVVGGTGGATGHRRRAP